MSVRSFLLYALVLATSLPSSAQNPTKVFPFPYTQEDLPNGLRLVTIPTDAPLLDKAEAQNRSWSVFYLTTRKLSDDGLKALEFPHKEEGLTEVARGKRNAGRALPDENIQAEITPLERYLKEGRSVEAGVNGVTNWRLYGRPVLAEKSCVSCHKATKEGEVLGAVVYAVEGG